MFLRRIFSILTIVGALLLPGVIATTVVPGVMARSTESDVSLRGAMKSAVKESAATMPVIPSANASDLPAAPTGFSSSSSFSRGGFEAMPSLRGGPTTWLMAFVFLGLIILRRTRSSHSS